MAVPARWLPESWVYNSMHDESVVNGVWSEILRSFFPIGSALTNNHYLVLPEFWVWNNKRTDLVVVDMDFANGGHVSNIQSVFAFEGKAAGANFDVTKSQLLYYVKRLDRRSSGRRYGMVGIGKQCAFFYHNGQDLVNIVANVAGGVVIGDGDNQNPQNIASYEFGVGINAECIHCILDFIVGKLAT